MPAGAKPVYTAMSYVDPKTGVLTQGGQAALAQWHSAINSIPVSVSGEAVHGNGKNWTLANLPIGNVLLIGITAAGPILLAQGGANRWSYSIEGKQITTQQSFEGVQASYEYRQG